MLGDVRELVAIADKVELGDSSADDGEGDHREGTSRRPDHGAGDAVDDRGPSERRQAGAFEHPFGDVGSATDRRLRLDPEHDVRVENLEQRVEVALAGGGQERVDDATLLGQIAVGRGSGAAYAPPCAACELTR